MRPLQIWATARQHPGEAMAEWCAEGLARFLNDADEPLARGRARAVAGRSRRRRAWIAVVGSTQARKLRSVATVRVINNMNPALRSARVLFSRRGTAAAFIWSPRHRRVPRVPSPRASKPRRLAGWRGRRISPRERGRREPEPRVGERRLRGVRRADARAVARGVLHAQSDGSLWDGCARGHSRCDSRRNRRTIRGVAAVDWRFVPRRRREPSP